MAGGLFAALGTVYFLEGTVLTVSFLGATVISVRKIKKPLASATKPGYDLDLLFPGVSLLKLSGPGEFSLLPGHGQF